MNCDKDETFSTFCDVSLTDDEAACCPSVTNVAFLTKTQEKNRIWRPMSQRVAKTCVETRVTASICVTEIAMQKL